ncbi:MAG: hypothetical protein COC20_01615 [Cellvibrionales bacterium]|nr:MAG: hypothetical protein COC20_01615 [Cellvibrionales bacterium]
MPFFLANMKNIKLIFLILAVLVAVFIGAWVVQDNPFETSIILLGFPLAELPVGLWVLVFFISGLIAGACLSYPAIFNLQRRSRINIKRLRKLDAELIKARNDSTV